MHSQLSKKTCSIDLILFDFGGVLEEVITSEEFPIEKAREIETKKEDKVLSFEEKREELPKIRLNHLIRMTDSTGLYHHAIGSIPNYSEGYCTDDNARALLLTVLLEGTYPDNEIIHNQWSIPKHSKS